MFKRIAQMYTEWQIRRLAATLLLSVRGIDAKGALHLAATIYQESVPRDKAS